MLFKGKFVLEKFVYAFPSAKKSRNLSLMQTMMVLESHLIFCELNSALIHKKIATFNYFLDILHLQSFTSYLLVK